MCVRVFNRELFVFLTNFLFFCFPPIRLIESLREKKRKTSTDLEEIEKVFTDIKELGKLLIDIQKEVVDLFVFGENISQTETALKSLNNKVDKLIQKTKNLIIQVRDKYTKAQQLVPSDVSQQLSSLELLSETISNIMEEKDREFKRAKTIRTEYLSDVEEIQTWIRKAELKVQDRSIEPQALKDHLQQIQSEIGTITDRLEKLIKNGKIIIEKSRDDEEKALIQSTINTLTDQLQQVRSWLDEKKQQVGDCLDAWQRFLTLYQAVMVWVEEKKVFLAEPLKLSTLHEARHKLNDYSVRCFVCMFNSYCHYYNNVLKI